MPKIGSWSLNLLATSAHAARVLLGCGVMSVLSTSDNTSTLSPPRIGSGHENTGCSTQSDLSPGAWLVLEPSKPQMGRSAPSSRILVFERSLAVGSEPSIQMYSALYAIGRSSSGLENVRGNYRRATWQRAVSRLLLDCERTVNRDSAACRPRHLHPRIPGMDSTERQREYVLRS